jgi:hypothetical protein
MSCSLTVHPRFTACDYPFGIFKHFLAHFVPLEGDLLLVALVTANIKCDSASNAPKYPLNSGVSIVKNLVVKLSNTSTMFFPPVMV